MLPDKVYSAAQVGFYVRDPAEVFLMFTPVFVSKIQEDQKKLKMYT